MKTVVDALNRLVIANSPLVEGNKVIIKLVPEPITKVDNIVITRNQTVSITYGGNITVYGVCRQITRSSILITTREGEEIWVNIRDINRVIYDD